MDPHLPQTIHCRGKLFRVQGRVVVRRRPYFLLELLSRRGLGTVVDGAVEPDCDERWLVIDTQRHVLDGLRSLQVLPGRLSRQRLRVLQRLTDFNPFAASVIDYERHRHATLIVSEWIPGLSLNEWLRRQSASRRRISLPECLRLYRGLVRTVSGFHRISGLVHGDIHPDNIVIGSRSRWLMLIDYGSAWRSLEAVQERQTQGFRALWAAPEINAGGIGDQRSDQFAATLVLFVLLTGELPFDRLGGRVGQYVTEDCNPFWEQPVDVIGARHSLSGKARRVMDEVLMQSLSINPEQRYSSDSAWITATDRLVNSSKGAPRDGSLFDRLITAIRAVKNNRTKNDPV